MQHAAGNLVLALMQETPGSSQWWAILGALDVLDAFGVVFPNEREFITRHRDGASTKARAIAERSLRAWTKEG